MRHIKPYNFCMKHFFFKCVFFEILRGFHTFGKPCIRNCSIYFVAFLRSCTKYVKITLWNFKVLFSFYFNMSIEKSSTLSLSLSLSLSVCLQEESEEGGVEREKKMAAMGLVGLRITRGWHGQVAALDSMFSSFKPSSLSLSLFLGPSRLSVPSRRDTANFCPAAFISLYQSQGNLAEQNRASKETRAWNHARHTWKGCYCRCSPKSDDGIASSTMVRSTIAKLR